MTDIKITLAKSSDAIILKEISISAFKNAFEKYGSYPTGIESVDWHKEEIGKGNSHKIKFNNEIVGGIYLIPHSNNGMEIKCFFISPKFHNNKIGFTVMSLIEDRYKNIKRYFLVTPYKEYKNHYFYEKIGYMKFGELSVPNKNKDFKLFKYEKIIKTDK